MMAAMMSGGGGGGDEPTPEPTGLPTGYTALEWLNGNGASQIRCNLSGLSLPVPFDVEVKITPTSMANTNCICGKNSNLQLEYQASGKAWAGQSASAAVHFFLDTDAVVTAKFRSTADASEYKVDGVDTGLHRATNTSDFAIFANGSNAYPLHAKLYYLKVFDATTGDLTHDIVPCLDENNVPCMYDKIGEKKLTFDKTTNVTHNLSN